MRARALNPRFIAGQLRHGPRGAAELAETVDRLVGFAETTDAVAEALIDAVHAAYVEDPAVRAFLLHENPAAGARHRRALRRRPPPRPLAPAAQRGRRRPGEPGRRGARPRAAPHDRALRRGACPSLAAPMPTGDGWLARLTLAEALTAGAARRPRRRRRPARQRDDRDHRRAAACRCAASPRRGGADLAAAVAGLGIAVAAGLPVLTGPLAGLDPDEIADPRPLAAALPRLRRARCRRRSSAVVDGGGRAAPRRGARRPPAARRRPAGGWSPRAARRPRRARSASSTTEAARRRARATRPPRRAADARARDLPLESVRPGPCRPRGRRDSDRPDRCRGSRRAASGCRSGRRRRRARRPRRAPPARRGSGRRRAGRCSPSGSAAEPTQRCAAAAGRLGFVARPDDPRLAIVACSGRAGLRVGAACRRARLAGGDRRARPELAGRAGGCTSRAAPSAAPSRPAPR